MTLEEEFYELENFIHSMNPEKRPWAVEIGKDNFGGYGKRRTYELYISGVGIATGCESIAKVKAEFMSKIKPKPKESEG